MIGLKKVKVLGLATLILLSTIFNIYKVNAECDCPDGSNILLPTHLKTVDDKISNRILKKNIKRK